MTEVERMLAGEAHSLGPALYRALGGEDPSVCGPPVQSGPGSGSTSGQPGQLSLPIASLNGRYRTRTCDFFGVNEALIG